MYKFVVKPILFLLPPETAHHFVNFILHAIHFIPFCGFVLRNSFTISDKALRRKIFGIEFPNPIGLAAGFDKDAKYFNELSNLGFGFIEIGTVTPLPQSGNAKPRLFRLPADEALINRMGFNNDGVFAAAERLKNKNGKIIIGGNIGKNKNTPNENALNDYETCFKALYEHVNYFVVNVSSPNTPGLRELQDKEPLKKILLRLKQINPQSKPILLKIAPDLSNEQLDDIVEIVLETKTDGVVATNTTIDRSYLRTSSAEIEKIGAGGLSGKPLKKRSTEVIKYLCEKSNHAFPVIGVGGIHSPEDAVEKLKAGASLVQIYTGFVYEGPGLVKKINKAILKNEKQSTNENN